MKLQRHMNLSMQPTLKPKSLYSVNPVPTATATAGISGIGCDEYEWRSKSKAIQGPHRSKEIAEITAREENKTQATERGCRSETPSQPSSQSSMSLHTEH